MVKIDAVIFDYGFTLSSEHYFNVKHSGIPNWFDLIQEVIFSNEEFVKLWMTGKRKLTDVAEMLHCVTHIDTEEILECLKDGCKKLKENAAVINFAKTLKLHSVPIALVTGNFDVFTEIVAPSHGYDKLFDSIINTADCGETDKLKLWPIAFDKFDMKIDYENSLLIEDTIKEIDNFKRMGGHAIMYRSDDQLMEELIKINHLIKKI
jgi:FMN phosphatase YigB (HAD superfamily)